MPISTELPFLQFYRYPLNADIIQKPKYNLIELESQSLTNSCDTIIGDVEISQRLATG